MAPTTRRGPNTPVNNTNPNNMTPESIQAMIDQALLRNSTNGDGSHSSHGDNRRNVQTARPCFYADFMKCQPLNFKGTEGVVGAALTWWNGQMRTLGPEAYAMTWEVKLEIELWNLKVKGNDVPAYTERFQELTLICTKFVANETEKVDKYISGLPDNIYGTSNLPDPRREKNPYGGSLPKCTKSILDHNGPCTQKCHKCNKVGHFARDCRSTGNTNVANTQNGNGAAPKGNGCFEYGAPGHFKRDCPKLKNKDGGNGKEQGDRSFMSTAFSSLIDIVPTPLDNSYDVELLMGKYFETSLSISAKKEEDKSEGKQIKDVPIVRDFPKVFPEDLLGLPPARHQWNFRSI
ncbi:putative reverse transcriptase domain-containing protein [Tanacetum coccineum]|uniref:Reverse transcriptase domain-containing protein n=1 Tax=Tanacetum coccineum TaxID=301880 RepID=A0ABQ5FHU2_9ASTR